MNFLDLFIINRYGLLSKNHSTNSPAIICRYILEENKLTEWQLGYKRIFHKKNELLKNMFYRKTKVFLKYYHPERLEKLMNRYRQAALLIQRSKFG